MVKVILEFMSGPNESGHVELYKLSSENFFTRIGSASWPEVASAEEIGRFIGKAIEHAIKEGSL